MWAPGTESRCPPPPAMWSAPCRMGEPNLYLHPLLEDPVPTNKLGAGGGAVFPLTDLVETSGFLTVPKRL